MSTQIKCVVPGCTSKGMRMIRFPNPKEERFLKWMEVIGNPNLALEKNQIYRDKKICLDHFSDAMFLMGCRKKRLLSSAIPNRNLPSDDLAGGKTDCYCRPSTSIDCTSPISDDLAVEEMDSFCHPSTSVDYTSPISDDLAVEEMDSFCHPSTSVDYTSPISERPAFGASTPLRARFVSGGRRQMLPSIGVRKLVDLTPKASYLIKVIQRLYRRMYCSSKKLVSFKQRLCLAEKALNVGIDQRLLNVSPTIARFLQCQIREASRINKGHRFTTDEKVFALALLKRSGRAYNFLSKMFVLPSKQMLLRLMQRLSFIPGINDDMFVHLSKIVRNMKEIDRHCILMFDEMFLSAHLDYSECLDIIEGFEDLGSGTRTSKFADKALVFMIQGLARKFKQPVAFVFLSGGINSTALATLLSEVIRKLISSGLKVVATVCDQCTSNVSAINKLCLSTKQAVLRGGGEYRGEYFSVCGSEEIIPLFDPPHLLKGIRNALLTKDLEFTLDGVRKTASWRHVQQMYAIDCRPNKSVPCLSDFHVVPDKIRKMKVKYCTQVFSQRLSSVMNLMASRSSGLEESATETAELLEFFDTLFDSVNGVSKNPERMKPLKCAISIKSGHLEFWKKAIACLQSMVYINGVKKIRTPSLNNWVRTLKNIWHLWNNLRKCNFKILATRNLNQDPLENIFDAIRSYGFCNNTPTCSNFIGTYKSLILNNMVASYAVGFNCEEDDCELLDNLREYLKMGITNDVCQQSRSTFPQTEYLADEIFHDSVEGQSISVRTTTHLSSTYTAGCILRKLETFQCNECMSKQHATSDSDHELIVRRERIRGVQALRYPSANFITCYESSRTLILSLLPNVCRSQGLLKYFRCALVSKINFNTIFCSEHLDNQTDVFCKNVVKLTIHYWCNGVNRFLSGRDICSYTDNIHEEAAKYFQKKCKFQRVSNTQLF